MQRNPTMLSSQLLRGSFQSFGRCLAQKSCRRLCQQPAVSQAIRASSSHAAAAAAVEAPAEASAPQQQHDAPAYKANIDFKFVRDNVDVIAQNCVNRGAAVDPHRVVQLYEEFVRLQQETDRVRMARNENSSAMKGKLEPERRQELIEHGKQLKEQLEELEARLVAAEDELQHEGQRLPNLTHPEAPIGGEDNAVVLKLVGSQRQFGFTPKDHVQLGEELDLVDFDRAAVVSGAKFYYLKNEAALLELALVNYAMQKVVRRGFMPLMTPDVVRESVFEKCGFQPRGANTQIYSLRDTSTCLTGTAEIPLGGMHMDQILSEAQLPIRMAAFGHCFRTEAGAAGSASRGLYRVHQFSKVEMFVVCTPEQSDALHQELIQIEAEMFEELGLHFKVLDMPTMDLGAPAYRKFDVEAWMPGMGRYGEISSASNCTDYQSRRLNIRYRPKADEPPAEEAASGNGKGGKKKGGTAKKVPTQFVHTLNATACAVPRMIVSILENYQQEDGSVVIPEALQPFMMGIEAIRPKAKAA